MGIFSSSPIEQQDDWVEIEHDQREYHTFFNSFAPNHVKFREDVDWKKLSEIVSMIPLRMIYDDKTLYDEKMIEVLLEAGFKNNDSK
jgi:hypothetical protein